MTVEKFAKHIEIENHSKRSKDIESFQIWDEISKHVNRSHIKRYNWKLIFGETLSKKILRYKLKGLNHLETYYVILEDPILVKLTKFFPNEAKRIKEKLKISVSARFGENDSAMKLMREEREK